MIFIKNYNVFMVKRIASITGILAQQTKVKSFSKILDLIYELQLFEDLSVDINKGSFY